MRTLILIPVLVLLGCTTVVQSEAELFFRRHPEARTRYSRFSPTDERAVEDCAFAVFTTRRHWAESVKKQDAQHADEMLQTAKKWYDEEMKLAASLRDAAARHRGQIYKFEIRQAPHGEAGYYIICHGEIVERVGVDTWRIHE